MKHQDHRRFGQGRDKPYAPPPLQSALRLAEALAARAEWRQELKSRGEAANGAAAPPVKPWRTKDDTARRAQFAEQVARAEFGRFYWSEKRQPGRPGKKKADKPQNAKSR